MYFPTILDRVQLHTVCNMDRERASSTNSSTRTEEPAGDQHDSAQVFNIAHQEVEQFSIPIQTGTANCQDFSSIRGRKDSYFAEETESVTPATPATPEATLAALPNEEHIAQDEPLSLFIGPQNNEESNPHTEYVFLDPSITLTEFGRQGPVTEIRINDDGRFVVTDVFDAQ